MNASTKIFFQEPVTGSSDTCDESIHRGALPSTILGLLDSWSLTTHGLLQCTSENDLSRIHQPDALLMELLEDYLHERGLRLREDEEPLLRRIETVYGHVRRAPVEILILQMDELSLGSVNLFPKESVERMKRRSIHTLGQFEGRTLGLLETFFPPAGEEQRAVVHWLEGMLQMAGIRLLPR